MREAAMSDDDSFATWLRGLLTLIAVFAACLAMWWLIIYLLVEAIGW